MVYAYDSELQVDIFKFSDKASVVSSHYRVLSGIDNGVKTQVFVG